MKHRLINTTRSLTLRALALTGRHIGPPAAKPSGADPTKEAAPPMPALSGEAAVRHLRQTGLYDSLSAALAATLYKADGRKGGGYEASNPRQNFRIVFTTEGVEAYGSSPAGLGWRLGMRLAAYGFGERKMPVTCAGIKAEGDRVEYELRPRDGADLSEWYVNRAEGLEHGFTVRRAPGERRAGEKLSLWVSLSGDLKARPAEEGRAILLDGRGTGLRYDSLHAHDATGRELPARMMLSGGGLKLEVSDEGAVYPVTIDPTLRVRLSVGRLNLEVWDEDAANPVTIDPTLSHEVKLTAGDGGEGDRFGESVAIDGDTAVVGAPFEDTAAGPNSGAAHVFVRSGTVWIRQAKLTPSDGATFDGFGSAVAIDGDTVVVGARSSGDFIEGAAYVFARSGTSWSQRAKLTVRPADYGHNFGCSVAISGDTVVVGAILDNEGAYHSGAAYVFVRSGTVWGQQAKLIASDAGVEDLFGHRVAIDGDTVVAGAPGGNTAAGRDAGAAYVFVRSGTIWTEQQKLTACDAATLDHFGSAVAIDGDTVIVDTGDRYLGSGRSVVAIDGDTAVVGAPFENTAARPNAGAAYVFVRSGTVWCQQAKLTASDVGSAYVFVRSGLGWSQQAKLTAFDATASDAFGWSVAISSDTVVVGARFSDTAGVTDAGSAYVFALFPGHRPGLSHFKS